MAEITSAGLLMYYKGSSGIKVFLVHPGGPFFTKKDEGYWGIPKGLVEKDEDLLAAAKREFAEETGLQPGGDFISLGSVVQKGGKTVHCWAFSCTSDAPFEITCNTFSMEWPPRSGRMHDFPEVDRGEFFTLGEAEKKINSAQKEFLSRLEELIKEKITDREK